MTIKKISSTLLIFSIFLLPTSTFAAPPSGGYTASQTLDPDCAPGELDCTVSLSSTFISQDDTPDDFTLGSLLFTDADSVTEDNTNLFWDDTNNRLGIGNATPGYKLDVNGVINSLVIKAVLNIFPGGLTLQGFGGFEKILKSNGSFQVGDNTILDSKGNLTGVNKIEVGEITSISGSGVFDDTPSVNTSIQINDYSVVTKQNNLRDFNYDGYLDLIVLGQDGDELFIYINNQDNTFTLDQTLASGLSTYYLDHYLFDVDFDGDEDVVVSTIVSEGVIVGYFPNDGYNSFGSFIILSTFTYSVSGSSAITKMSDMNNDGFLDLLLFTESEMFSVYQNNGDNTFSLSDSVATSAEFYYATFDDFDGDGNTDIYILDTGSGLLRIFYNEGSLSTIFDNEYSSYDYGFLNGNNDFNNDSSIDLLYPDGDGIGWFQNNNNGSFTDSGNIHSGDVDSESALVTGDLNKDGYIDIVATDGGQDISVLINNRDGTFESSTFSTARQYESLILVDMNNDSVPDLIGFDTGNNVDVYFQTPQVLLHTDTASGRVGIGTDSPDYELDVEGQIGADTVHSDIVNSRVIKAVLNIFPGGLTLQGFGGFEKILKSNGSFQVGDNTILDSKGNLTGVNKIEVGEITSISGSGVFDDTPSVNTSIQINDMSGFGKAEGVVGVRDVNLDGYDDIFTVNDAGNSVLIYTNDQDGTFTLDKTLVGASGSSVTTFYFLDYDLDGFEDIFTIQSVASGTSVSVGYFPNNGYDLWGPYINLDTIDDNEIYLGSSSNEVGDLNGDGNIEIIFYSDSEMIYLYSDNGNGEFTLEDSRVTDADSIDFFFEDFNGDGLVDILYYEQTNLVPFLYLNNGNLATIFDDDPAYSGEYDNPGFTIGDFNNDNSFDVTSGFAGAIVMQVNDNNDYDSIFRYSYLWTQQEVVGVPTHASDFNKDGYLDMVTTDGTDIQVLVNDAGSIFSPSIFSSVRNHEFLLMSDMNNDSVPDLIGFDTGNNVDVYFQTPQVLLHTDTASGRVGIGTDSPDTTFHVAQTGTGAIATFTDGDSETSCTVDGTSFSCSSDERLKKNFEGITGALDSILQLNPVKYLWKNEDETAQQKIGFKAQEVQPLFPELVGQTANGYLTLNYAGLTPVLAGAIKDVYSQFNSVQPLGDTTADSQITAFLADMRQKVIHGTTHIYELIVSSLTTRNISIEETLCVGDVCIGEDELLQLLENAEIEPLENSPSRNDDFAELNEEETSEVRDEPKEEGQSISEENQNEGEVLGQSESSEEETLEVEETTITQEEEVEEIKEVEEEKPTEVEVVKEEKAPEIAEPASEEKEG